MKKIIITLAVILFCAATTFAADPVEGFWLSVDPITEKIQSGWEMYESNGHLYGKMLSAVGCSPTDKAHKCDESYPDFPIAGKVNQLPIIGTPWMFGLSMESPGHWTNGYIVNPDDGNMYKLSLTYHPADGKKFHGETLEIHGQLLHLALAVSQYWRRATREEASALK
ncbi:DUF2147 domain-containing protein [Treponema sp. R80B11-R83G3]